MEIKFSLEQEQDIISRYNDGQSLRMIAKNYNISHHVISRFLDKNNIRIKKVGISSNQKIELLSSQKDEILLEYINGETATNIAKKYNVNPTTIINIIKKNNIEIRHHSSYKMHTIKEIKEMLKKYEYEMVTDKSDIDRIRLDGRISFKDKNGYIYDEPFRHFFQNPDTNFYAISKMNKYAIHNLHIWLELNNNSIKLLSDKYYGTQEPLQFYCLNCEENFESSWDKIQRLTKYCPLCNVSNGENKIQDFLIENNVLYIQQYKFDDCRNILPLPFDFAIFNDKNELYCVCEFNGKQHYEPIEYFGGIKTFKTQQKRDNIKRKYCKNNNIKLVEIPYWDYDNIESILTKELNL